MAIESRIEEVKPVVLKLITEHGLYKKQACAIAGISYRQWLRWEEKGKEEIERVADSGARAKVRKSAQPYVDLVEQLRKAEAERNKNLVTTVYEAGKLPRIVKETKITQFLEKGIVVNEVRVVTRKEAPPEWRAAIAMLERTDKENWSRRSEITGADGRELPSSQLSVQNVIPGFSDLPKEVQETILKNLVLTNVPPPQHHELESLDRGEFFSRPANMTDAAAPDEVWDEGGDDE